MTEINDSDKYLIIDDALRLPLAEIDISFGRSQGPGGQHVNKSSTRVSLTFDVVHSPTLVALGAAQHARLCQHLASRLSNQGQLRLTVQETRSQHQNRALALERLQRLLQAARHMPKRRRPTRVSRGAKTRRREANKRQSKKKRDRQRRWQPD